MPSDVPVDTPSAQRHAILFAPFGNDAALLSRMLHGADIPARVCHSFTSLMETISDDALFVILTEEALASCNARELLSRLEAQPHWSDLPFIGLIGGPGARQEGERLALLSRIGNITILERPVSTEALMMLVRTAMRARQLQYRIRAQFDELGQYSRELEARVDSRTAALAKEIDERKRIEAALQESRRLESLGRLTGGIAHDFNNMLQVISGGVELMRALTPNADARVLRAMDSISRAGKNGAKLTQQLLAYARHQPLQNVAIDLRMHVQSLTDLIQHSLGRSITLAIEVDAGLWPIRADLTQFDVALLNLVFNARDAMPDGGVATLSLSNCTLPDARFPELGDATGDFVAIALSDQGAGVSEEVAARAFEPFYTTKPAGKGTGLGLSQVQGFAVQSGGQAFLRPLTTGAMATMLLPRSQDGNAIAELSPTAAAGNAAQGKRVLCVEDHYEVMAVACGILDQLGASVIPAATADEAAAVPLAEFDLVFSDVMMPGSMDGVELAQRLRSQQPALPIVLASGYVLDPGRLEELAVTFVHKPYTAADVEQAISREIALRAAARGNSG